MTAARTVDVSGLDQVGEARRVASQIARSLDFNETDIGRVAIATTEVATNLVKHAQGGQVLIEVFRDGAMRGLVLMALDRGPGIVDRAASMRDGFSTTGTLGTGLGAIERQSNRFDLFTAPGRGTVVWSRFWPGGQEPQRGALTLGGLSVCYPGEELCGDAWDVVDLDGRTKILVADGLGHGPLAHSAAESARTVFRDHAGLSPVAIVDRLHAAMKSTRGAAIAVTEVDRSKGLIRFCGVGNVAGCVLHDGARRNLVSLHGTVGHDMRKTLEFQYPWTPTSLLVLHTDGISSRCSLDGYSGLSERDPGLVAAVLYRDFVRGRDDATVLVAREAA